MSTKSSLAYGPGFHLYHEMFDDDNVYLEVEGTHFEASYNRVRLPIPVHIWEVIRRYPGVSFECVDKTDAELRDDVERQVDERLKQYQEANDEDKPRLALFGSFKYGSVKEPRDTQIEKGVAYFVRIREHQQQIQRAIAELLRLQGQDESHSSDREL